LYILLATKKDAHNEHPYILMFCFCFRPDCNRSLCLFMGNISDRVQTRFLQLSPWGWISLYYPKKFFVHLQPENRLL